MLYFVGQEFLGRVRGSVTADGPEYVIFGTIISVTGDRLQIKQPLSAWDEYAIWTVRASSLFPLG